MPVAASATGGEISTFFIAPIHLIFQLATCWQWLAGAGARFRVLLGSSLTPVRYQSTSKDSSSGNVTGVVWSSVFLAASTVHRQCAAALTETRTVGFEVEAMVSAGASSGPSHIAEGYGA